MNMKKFLCLCLCTLAVFAMGLTACSPEGATPDEASVPTSQNTETTIATETSSKASDTTAADTESQDKDNDSGNAVDAGPVDPGENSDSYVAVTPEPCTITVGNKDYHAKTGDTVTYTFYLTTPKAIENVQATLSYDSKVLKLMGDNAKDMFPVLGDSAIYNIGIKDTVKFNASDIKGYDFTSRSALVTLDFRVVDGGNTGISTAIEVMDEKGGTPYIDALKIVGNITCEEIITQ